MRTGQKVILLICTWYLYPINNEYGVPVVAQVWGEAEDDKLKGMSYECISYVPEM